MKKRIIAILILVCVSIWLKEYSLRENITYKIENEKITQESKELAFNNIDIQKDIRNNTKGYIVNYSGVNKNRIGSIKLIQPIKLKVLKEIIE